MITISLQLDPDNPRDVAEARAILDLLAEPPAPHPPSSPQVESPESEYDDIVANWWARLGSNLRELVKASAELDPGFTMVDLAETLGQTPTWVRSRFANLARSSIATQKAMPAAPDVFYHAKDHDGTWYFTLDPDIRVAIQRIAASRIDH